MTDLPIDNAHTEWLEDRGLLDTVIARAPIGSYKGALAFEYPGFLKLRSVSEKRFWIEPAGARLSLWLLDQLTEPSSAETPLVVTEGEIDALACLQAGVECVVSVPNGAPAKPGEGDINPAADTQFGYLWEGGKLHPKLLPWRKIVLATDGDGPGQVLREELAIRLGRTRCWFVVYPAGCKDANDVLRRHGEAAVQDLIEQARPIVPNKLVKFSDIPTTLRPHTFETYWGPRMDEHLMIVPPELMVITGVPGSGKSQWALALVSRLAFYHKLPGAILQFEDDVNRNRFDLLRFRRTRLEDPCMSGPDSRWLDQYVRTIAPSEDIDGDVDFNLAWLKTTIEEACTRHGARWILIDPWNEIEHCWGGNETETAYTTKALKDLKRLARRYQIAMIIVTHPSKGGGQLKSVEDMSLYDVSGSAAWKNKADHGIIIHRNAATDQIVSVKIDKSKNFTRLGKPGIVRMEFLAASSDYRIV